jgi:hypothetical protein
MLFDNINKISNLFPNSEELQYYNLNFASIIKKLIDFLLQTYILYTIEIYFIKFQLIQYK